MTQALLNLDELALLRGWLHGLPMEALADFCSGDSPSPIIEECRTRLILKARRLQMAWGTDWLERGLPADPLALALRRIDIVQATEDIAPDTAQPLAYWLRDSWLDKLAPLNLVTVADWQQAYQAAVGKTWWDDITGLGSVTAKAIETALAGHFPGLLVKAKPPVAVIAYQTAIVPLAHFLVPEAMDGSAGNNRSPHSPFIPASDDYQALQCWLARLAPDSHTHRSYRREAERLLLWTVLVKHKALSSLDMIDMGEYRLFLADPQPAHLWVGAPQKKGHGAWKPFTGPLSLRSRRLSETILNSLFTFLVNQHYLLHNPLQALPKLKNPNSNRPLDIHRSFTEAQWQLLSGFLDRSQALSDGAEQLKWLRTRLLVQLAYATGLRLHELANVTLGDIETRQRQGQTQYWLTVLGKGQKLREVPLPLSLYSLMLDTYRQLTGTPLGRAAPDSPLIPPLRGPDSNCLTPLAIHKIVKEAFTLAADHLAAAHPETADKLRQASTHWLRHTHGSLAVDRNIPLTMIRDNLGHSNIATTSYYVHADDDARHGAFAEGFETR